MFVRNLQRLHNSKTGIEKNILEMRGISKTFPGVVALDDVCLELHQGEVLGLIGENGAGKSTLMKVLGGLFEPDSGQVLIDGRVVDIRSVSDAMSYGIAFIHQELNVLDNIDVAGNVFLGREPTWTPFRLIDRQRIYNDTEPYLKRLGLDISSRTPVRDLSIAQRQMVEIAKALSLNARIIIMDEPTSSLTLTETERLLQLVVELKSQGVSVIYISHRLGELDSCADRVVVLRDGKNAGELSSDEIDHDEMVRMMVGRDIDSFYVAPKGERYPGFFKVRGIRSIAYPEHAISFDAAKGEILGFAGLVGAGRSELMEAVFGVHKIPGGEIFLGEERVEIWSARDAIKCGIYLVPEDRRSSGLVTEMSVTENVTLPSLQRYSVAWLINRNSERTVAEEQRTSLNIKTPSVETSVVSLSGGNQQKVVLGKWLSMEPTVIIFDEPTRGIDVGAKAEIYRLMRDLAQNGAVVIMVSSDMEEILNVSDRVAVMHEGRITGVLDRKDCEEENIMLLAVGKEVDAAVAPYEQEAAAFQ